MNNDTQQILEKFIGRVKWFNNTAGYGFVTIKDEESNTDIDIFVHHSSIKVDKEQYKYLVQGEYIEFNLVKTNDGKHEVQAVNISGINGGKLMCETRNELRIARNEYKDTKNENNDDETNNSRRKKKDYNNDNDINDNNGWVHTSKKRRKVPLTTNKVKK